MAPDATDMSAQIAAIKADGGDTLFVTTGVEQLTLVLKQAADLRLNHQIITSGGSQSPDQLIEQAGAAANGSNHILFFARGSRNRRKIRGGRQGLSRPGRKRATPTPV